MADLTRVHNNGRINCFFVLKESEGPALQLEIVNIEVLADDLWLPIAGGPVEIDSAAIGAGQIFLGSRSVPPASYRQLRFLVNKGAVRQADGTYAVIASKPFHVELTLPSPLLLGRDDSHTLLLTWDVQESLGPDNLLRPIVEISTPVRQLPVDLIYITCPDIDTIFLVRTDRNWVVDSFGLRGSPTWLAIDPDPSRQRLYVLAAQEAMVKVVDRSSHRVVDFFPVPLGDVPTFMAISPDGRWAYLLDARSGYLSRMDLNTGRSAARVRLGSRPYHAVPLERQSLLAVSLLHSNQVVLLDPLNLNVVRSISTGNGPQGLTPVGSHLYITEGNDNMVSVVDLNGQRMQSRMAVGLNPQRLVNADGVLYISNYDSGSLSILMPDQLGVIREVHGLDRPMEMVYHHFYRRLYVTEERTGALAVVDVNANRLIGRIALGSRPLGLAVVQ